jgi:hypothetical protein
VAKVAAGAHLPLTLQGKVKGAGRRRRKNRDFLKAVSKNRSFATGYYPLLSGARRGEGFPLLSGARRGEGLPPDSLPRLGGGRQPRVETAAPTATRGNVIANHQPRGCGR